MFHGNPIQYPEWKAAFNALINQRAIPAQERYYYLKRYVSGCAKEAIDGYLYSNSEDAFIQAMGTLEERFGVPAIIARAFRNKLELWPNMGPNDGTALRKLADFLAQCEAAYMTVSSLSILNDERENQNIFRKLPGDVKHRWVRNVAEYRQKTSLCRGR